MVKNKKTNPSNTINNKKDVLCQKRNVRKNSIKRKRSFL